MRKLIVSLAVLFGMTGTALAQAEVESRVSKLEGGLPAVSSQVQALQSQVTALQTLVNDAATAAAANTAAIEALGGGGDLGALITALDWRVANVESTVGGLSSAVGGLGANVASLDLRVMDLEDGAGGGGDPGSPGLVIASETINNTTDASIYPEGGTPIYAARCSSFGINFEGCLLQRSGLVFEGYGLRVSVSPFSVQPIEISTPRPGA